ncbi:MAG: hypothetical protein E5X94_00695 [Mesorhizobium sp.]|nr:MAG: hypothetical protein E5X94_00695 [Mesorhizobium sp.]
MIFTPDQVVNLAENQTGGAIHPFTCANRGDGNHRFAFGDLGALVPTVRGWICPFCDYTQDWAHGFMAARTFRAAIPSSQAILTRTLHGKGRDKEKARVRFSAYRDRHG